MLEKVVLVVVEDGGVGDLLRQLIRNELGCQTALARGREQAMQRIRNGRPAAVVLDLPLPEQEGIGIIEEIKGDLATRDIPVIALTTPYQCHQKLRQAGSDACLAKPLDLDGLVGAVAQCLGAPSSRANSI